MEYDQPPEGQGALHRPNEDWYCTDDGQEWPCPIYIRRMWSWYPRPQDRHRLHLIMTSFRDSALGGGMSRPIADARFLNWIDGPPLRQIKRSI
ncbi:hypothetical protein OG792_07540 [Micromonospora sp. NBC_01699]|uniref:hypothetical protein n=1 Tax=Micromonospora sp. NBC_01699 TaxID=2975984 RepID=UPI002E3125FD|nr:hypothetical protein [Micromonospora sp. NBC_01699]